MASSTQVYVYEEKTGRKFFSRETFWHGIFSVPGLTRSSGMFLLLSHWLSLLLKNSVFKSNKIDNQYK